MTPCEKLGYKVGDKFEMLRSSCGFKKGQVVTLFRDDRTNAPCFKGDNTEYNHAGGEPGAYINLSNVKPVSQRVTKPISKSKRQLAQLLIEAGVTQFPEGANWAAQDKCDGNCMDRAVSFFGGKHKPKWFGRLGKMWKCAVPDTTFLGYDVSVALPTLIPNWHQTVLSRDEFDQIVAETVVQDESELVELTGEDLNRMRKPQYCESVTRSIPEPTTPTLDQMLQDWRNADDYAQRKQTEADEAAAMRDERWQAVQTRAGEFGVTVGRCEDAAVDELAVTDQKDLQVGDEIKVTGFTDADIMSDRQKQLLDADSCTVVAAGDGGVQIEISSKSKGCMSGWHLNGILETQWRFIRRP
ncbi:MAG: hypothetical protein ACRC8I_11580 [Plesiomonas shigelloides]